MDSVEFQIGNHTLWAHTLSAAEVVQDYLPLRFSTLHREMHWAKDGPKTPFDLRDGYDETAWPFGIYLDGQLVAATRLVSADSPAELPSGSFITDLHMYTGRSAEISKAVVDSSWRNCGLFWFIYDFTD